MKNIVVELKLRSYFSVHLLSFPCSCYVIDGSIGNVRIMSDSDRRHLFGKAMEVDWEAVVRTCEDQSWPGKEKITKGDTVLHIVLDRQESIAQKLVRVIVNQKDVLDIQNEKGNTPLHLAAAIGSVSMCVHIACDHPYLVGVCNDERETPLFVAARHGKIDAFFCLIDMSRNSAQYNAKLRNKNGETILHCAIAGGHFKLAYLITQPYEDLVNAVDDRGVIPLHLLANKPIGLRSGTHLSLIGKIIDHCILVAEVYRPPGDDKNSKNQTRTDLLRVLWSKINVFTGPSYINKIEQKKEKHIWSAKVLHKLLKQAKKYRYDGTGKNPQYTKRTMPYDKEESEGETQAWNVNFSPKRAERGDCRKKVGWQESSEEGPSCIHETQQQHVHGSTGNEKKTHVTDMNFSPKRDGGGNSLKNQRWQKSYKEDPSWSLLLRLGKASLRAEPIIVAGQPAKRLDDELILLEAKMKTEETGRLETSILIAAKNGIKEMVERILDLYPMAIHDIDSNKKNIMLLAVETRHPHVYELLLKRNILKDSVFGAVDNNGNSALHLAAMFADYRPWLTPGAAMQMQWEVKWYEYVKKFMPPNFFRFDNCENESQSRFSPNFFRFHNYENESAKQIFTREHKGLVQNGGQWLNSTATSCSGVAS